MPVSWKSHGLFTLYQDGVTWSIEVARPILEAKAGRPLLDLEMDAVAQGMASELREAAIAKVAGASGPERWVQLEPGDPHLPAI